MIMSHLKEYREDVKVSVFIVAYNHEDYIKDALEGALSQKTTFQYEIIIHDDASTDNTAKIIKEYERRYPDKIIAFYEETNSYSHYWDFGNKMFQAASGVYAAFCDGDDYWTDENKLQMQYDFMESHPEYSLCVHNSLVLNAKTGESGFYANYETGELSQGYVIEHAGAVFHTSSHFFRFQEWLRNHDSTDTYDLARVCYLASAGKIMYFDKCMSVYRIHTKESWTENISNRYNLIPDYISRLSFYNKFDENTDLQWHENITKISSGIVYQMFYDMREIYRDLSFKRRINLLLAWTLDCFGLYPLRTWIKKHIGI